MVSQFHHCSIEGTCWGSKLDGRTLRGLIRTESDDVKAYVSERSGSPDSHFGRSQNYWCMASSQRCGPWPPELAFGHFFLPAHNPHPENSGPSTSQDCWSGKGLPRDKAGLGCFGIYLFSVKDTSGKAKQGMGVHSGRTPAPPKGDLYSLGGSTYGCIRVPPAAMLQINEVHLGGDPVETITVETDRRPPIGR